MKLFLLFIVFYILNTYNAFSQPNCNNWLNLSNSPDGVTIGDLDLRGNKLTVEAVFNRTETYYGGPSYAGDLVSKHLDPTDCNYLLRPGHAEMTTTNGFFATPEKCDIKLNKTYHVAMVYDGAILKFYRNGFLMGQVNATGNLITNDWLTKIGETASPRNTFATELKGFINEVRIWNVARTQQQIRENMNSSLSNPSTQPGLLAYYTFDNLLNKQGNAAWNGSITGTAVINSTNTSCNFVADSCDGISDTCGIKAGKDTSACAGSTFQLNVSGADSYSWFPATGLSNSFIANPVVTVNSTITYIITGTTLGGCTAKDTIVVSVLPKPSINISNDTSICGNGSIQLSASGGNLYLWTPSTGLSNNNISNPTAFINNSITYKVAVTGANGCNSSDSVSITLLTKPVVKASKDTTSCGNDPIQLNVSGGSKYRWTPSDGLNATTIANPVATSTFSQTYIVTGYGANGCYAVDSTHLNRLPLPVITVSHDTAICKNGIAYLFATGENEYTWSPSAGLNNSTIANPVATPAISTKYYVDTKGINSCEAKDSVTVIVKSPAIFKVSPTFTSVCSTKAIQLIASGGNTYLWQPDSSFADSHVANPVVSPRANTTFSVFIRDSSCNTDTTLTVQVTVDPLPEVSVSKENDINCSSPSAQLTAHGGQYYLWKPSFGLNDPTISDPVATVNTSTLFYVTVTSDRGCQSLDSIKVNSNLIGNVESYQLPTAFTLNSDGLNDCFGIKKWGNVEVLEFEVYNRYGEKIFNGNNIRNCWDGTYNGKKQQEGAYPYIIKIKTACGVVERKGLVLLIQ